MSVPSKEQVREYVDGDSVHLCILAGQTRGAVSRLGGTEFPIPDHPRNGVSDPLETLFQGGVPPPGIRGSGPPETGFPNGKLGPETGKLGLETGN